MAFRAFTALNSGATNQPSTISSVVPASCVAGDVLIITGQQSRGTNTLTVANSGPSTPSLVSGPQVTDANNTVYVWVLTLASGDLGATITINAPSGGYFDGSLHAFSGVQRTGMLSQVTNVSTAATSVTTPTVTTTVANCDIVQILALRSATTTSATATPPATQTRDGAATTGASGASPSFTVVNGHRTTPGAAGSYGGATWTLSQACTGSLFTIALQPTGVSGTDTGFMAYWVDSAGTSHRCDVYWVNASGTAVQISSKTS